MLEVDTALSPERASVFRNSYMTACYALMQRGRLAAGEKVLIHGAAGGIGVPAIQVAKLHGAEVIATATGEAKRAICLEEGDDYAIEYQGGFHDRVMELTGGC
jgi:NADPH2:quinone reductase